MGSGAIRTVAAVMAALWLVQPAKLAHAQRLPPLIMPEQRTIQVRDPSQLPHARIPDSPPPATVSDPQPELQPRFLSLDEAIRTSLMNANVVRILAGVTATTSGRTIYDAAITNTTIDQQRARFDPTLKANNSFNQVETPIAIFDPANPGQSLITGTQNNNYNLNAGVSKQTVIGGQANLGVNTNPTLTRPGVFPLNPSNRSSLDLSYTQPLLQGGGAAVNLAPIVLARIDTERSYFQFKDSVQEHVRGVIEAYWALVFARVDTWAREQQVEQSQYALDFTLAAVRAGSRDAANLAQAQAAAATFRANLVTSRANVLLREAALRNILGLPPVDGERIVPVSPPTLQRLEPDWQSLLVLAEERRPDVVELKLIIEADQQLLLQSQNTALPRVDAVALYRWNGLEGEMPNSTDLRSRPGQFTDWTMGVNFSVPLGLRQARAALRRQELLIARDRTNLDQGVHNAVHILALNVRGVSQFYEQYLAFRDLRIATRRNLDIQLRRYIEGYTGGVAGAGAGPRAVDPLFLNVLQAITDWGNAISNEANSLTQYNTQLATLERQTGTILETHGVAFYEERFGSLGPLGRWQKNVCYPADQRPTPNDDRYQISDQPAENSFDLQKPDYRRKNVPQRNLDEIELPREPLPDLGPPEAPGPAPAKPANAKPVSSRVRAVR